MAQETTPATPVYRRFNVLLRVAAVGLICAFVYTMHLHRPLSASPLAPAARTITDQPPARIAIVIVGAGLHARTTRDAITRLPAGITFAFAPIATESVTLSNAAFADGHTVLAELPLEPYGLRPDRNAAYTLHRHLAPGDNERRLARALERVPHAAGIATWRGSQFLETTTAAEALTETLARRGLVFIRTDRATRVGSAHHAGLHTQAPLNAAETIDRIRDRAAIRERLDSIERQARRGRPVIAIGTAYRETISALANWAEDAQERGVDFVQLTDLTY